MKLFSAKISPQCDFLYDTSPCAGEGRDERFRCWCYTMVPTLVPVFGFAVFALSNLCISYVQIYAPIFCLHTGKKTFFLNYLLMKKQSFICLFPQTIFYETPKNALS